MKITLRNSILLFFLILSSCSIFCGGEDHLLRNEREDYLGDNLRVDGFYYNYFEGKISNVIFLYRNGVCFKIIGDGKERTKPEEIQTLLTEVERMERYKTYKDLWGIFLVNGDEILIEKWNPPLNGIRATVIESGYIINDTSFIITKRDDSQEGIEDAHYEYFFYPYSPKPDSTNIFIK